MDKDANVIAETIQLMKNAVDETLENDIPWILNTSPHAVEDNDSDGVLLLERLYARMDYDIVSVNQTLADLMARIPFLVILPAMKNAETSLFYDGDEPVSVTQALAMAEEALGRDLRGIDLYHILKATQWWAHELWRMARGTALQIKRTQERLEGLEDEFNLVGDEEE